MTAQVEHYPGTFGPREIEVLSTAYWELLTELSEAGWAGIAALQDMPARELRRWLAKHLIDAAKAGTTGVTALKAAALSALRRQAGEAA